MKAYNSALIKILIFCYLSVLCVSRNFDFFYFVQQWPGSYCDTEQGCCYPKTGKPAADFSIHGLWPNFDNGDYPSYCNDDNPFDESEISDLTCCMEKEWPSLSCKSNHESSFWAHEWNKHGTCSESVLDQHDYFQAALNLKKKVNLLQILKSSGIVPDDTYYRLKDIREAITDEVGYTPGITCNWDDSDNNQLSQIYLCVDHSGLDLIECPILPEGNCHWEIQFPSF